MKNRGFTLIELLVVIAIIGILSSVVLVSLNSARNRGKDTRVISAVQQLRTIFEGGYVNGAYPDLCGTSATITAGTTQMPVPCGAAGASTGKFGTSSNTQANQLVSDVIANGGVIHYMVSTGTGDTNVTNYAIYGKLPSNTSNYFCIDSTGKTNQANSIPVAGATDVNCD